MHTPFTTTATTVAVNYYFDAQCFVVITIMRHHRLTASFIFIPFISPPSSSFRLDIDLHHQIFFYQFACTLPHLIRAFTMHAGTRAVHFRIPEERFSMSTFACIYGHRSTSKGLKEV
jgi:hypothetical protein